jgi:hypothetical protein
MSLKDILAAAVKDAVAEEVREIVAKETRRALGMHEDELVALVRGAVQAALADMFAAKD